MQFKSFRNLFQWLLAEGYSIEERALKTFPEVLKKVHSPDLKAAISTHIAEIKNHMASMNEVIKKEKIEISKKPRCPVAYVFDELENHIHDNDSSPLLDASIIAHLQQIEHAEIALYGTLKAYSRQLNEPKLTDWLKDVVKEEVRADTIFSKIAQGEDFQSGINRKAA